jgi:hypothetical protein
MNISEVTDRPAIPIPRVRGSQSPSLSLHQFFLRCSGDLRDLLASARHLQCMVVVRASVFQVRGHSIQSSPTCFLSVDTKFSLDQNHGESGVRQTVYDR